MEDPGGGVGGGGETRREGEERRSRFRSRFFLAWLILLRSTGCSLFILGFGWYLEGIYLCVPVFCRFEGGRKEQRGREGRVA